MAVEFHGNAGPRRLLEVTRREFLRATAAGTGALLAIERAVGAELGGELPTHRFRVMRDADLLSLEFSFVNFEVRGEHLWALGGGRSLAIVRFAGQNLAEAILDEPPDEPGFEIGRLTEPSAGLGLYSPRPPLACFMSGPSWIVFVVDDEAPLPMTDRAARACPDNVWAPGATAPGARKGSAVDCWLRRMAGWRMRIPGNASRLLPPSMPRADETCLEIPFRLFISPTSADTRWLTSSERWPLDRPAVETHELWHAALMSNQLQVPAGLPPGMSNIPPELAPPTRIALQAKAVFSPDYRRTGQPDYRLFYPGNLQLSLHALTRHLLVKQMAEGNGWIDAEHLILSALGSDASLSYTTHKSPRQIIQEQLDSPSEPGTELAIWKQRIVIGRDDFIVEAFYGFLFPFVHPAIFVELTRRKFAARALAGNKNGPPAAYLLKEYFILVQDPLREYTDSECPPGRMMPFKKVTLRQLTSPLLRKPGKASDVLTAAQLQEVEQESGVSDIDQRLAFVPKLLNADQELRWQVDFEDESLRHGHTSDMFLLFVDNVKVGQAMWRLLDEEYRHCTLEAQALALAPDRAELALPNPGNRSLPYFDSSQPPGTALVRRTLDDVERKGARTLADAVRRWKQDGNRTADQVFDLLKRDRQQIATQLAAALEVIGRAQADLSQLRDETFAAIKRIGDTVNQVADKTLLAQDLLAQLGRAEQVSSTLETHGLTFGSMRIDNLLIAVGAGGALRIGLDSSNSVDDFKKAIAAVDSAILSDRLKNRLASDVVARVASVADWSESRREIGRYLDAWKSIAQKAENINADVFHAEMEAADVIIPALKAMAPDAPVRQIELLDDYVAKGLHNVQQGVFARLAAVVDQGKAMADNIRTGVASPAAIVAGVSRDLGAVMGNSPQAVTNIAQQLEQKLDLSDAIPDAKLFGVLPLRRLLGEVVRGQTPTIQLAQYPDHVEHTWEWTAPLQDLDLGIVRFHANPAQSDMLRLHLTLTTRVETPKPQDVAQHRGPQGQVTVKGFVGLWDELGKHAIDPDDYAFGIEVLRMIDVRFERVDMAAQYQLGQDIKPSLTPKLDTVVFEGPLQFVKTLADQFSGLGGGVEPILEGDRIGIRLNLPIPAIAFGAFALANLQFGVGVTLSLANDPLRFEFNFSTWENPFLVSVMCFGGRGFFRASLMTNGAKELEGALEFGGALSFDVGVASGGLYVMAGAYFHITDSTTDLSGYLRAGGCVQVLGLIHASIEFLLMFGYRDLGTSHQLYGIARITVSIDLFLFHADVTLTMEKVIEGSSGNSGNASVPRHVLAQIGSPAPGALPTSYFDRPGGPRTDRVVGRFPWETSERRHHAKQWVREYWSQFDFSAN